MEKQAQPSHTPLSGVKKKLKLGRGSGQWGEAPKLVLLARAPGLLFSTRTAFGEWPRARQAGMAGLAMFDQKNVIAVTIIIGHMRMTVKGPKRTQKDPKGPRGRFKGPVTVKKWANRGQASF
jgi:hypothetical protein